MDYKRITKEIIQKVIRKIDQAKYIDIVANNENASIAEYPELEVLADTKIMDAGDYEAELTYKAGADYCTVLGVTDTLTIKGCLDAAEKYGKKVFVDMICVKDIEGRVVEIEEAGVNCIGVHVGVDLQAAGGINHAEDPVAAATQVEEEQVNNTSVFEYKNYQLNTV